MGGGKQLASMGSPKLREEGTGLEEEEVRAGQSLSCASGHKAQHSPTACP